MASAAAYPFQLGDFHRAVTCAHPEAQHWFDRGMAWAFGFHHEEAILCFERALAHDPGCAMAHWGVGYCNGPNYNFHTANGYYGLSAQETGYPSMKLAFEATARATASTAGVSVVERDLIDALATRYAWPLSDTAPELLLPYAGRMRALHAKHPADAEVSFAFADALMVLHPWQLWDLTSGESTRVP